MDRDNSLEITYDEWRSFFMTKSPILETVTDDPHEMLRYWRGATVCLFEEKAYSIFIFVLLSTWILVNLYMLLQRMKKQRIHNGGDIF